MSAKPCRVDAFIHLISLDPSNFSPSTASKKSHPALLTPTPSRKRIYPRSTHVSYQVVSQSQSQSQGHTLRFRKQVEPGSLSLINPSSSKQATPAREADEPRWVIDGAVDVYSTRWMDGMDGLIELIDCSFVRKVRVTRTVPFDQFTLPYLLYKPREEGRIGSDARGGVLFSVELGGKKKKKKKKRGENSIHLRYVPTVVLMERLLLKYRCFDFETKRGFWRLITFHAYTIMQRFFFVWFARHTEYSSIN